MARVVRHLDAEGDLRDAWFYISRHDAAAADRLLDKIDTTLLRLSRHPLSGRARPELGPDLRSVPVKPYLIFDRPLPDGIEVVRVLHGARHLDALFKP